MIDPRLSAIIDCLYRVSVKGVIIVDHKLLLVKESGDDWWSVPGGGIDHGESIEAALIRELNEELGTGPRDLSHPKLLFASVGGVIDKVPRFNVFYAVKINAKSLKKTPHVDDYRWYLSEELDGLYLSPSVQNDISIFKNLLV